MSNQNNASIISPLPNNDRGLFTLPTRGEKRFITLSIDSALVGDDGQPTNITAQDFEITAAKSPFTDYVLLRIPGRGLTETGVPDPHSSVYFQFLINPAQISITRQQLDAQALARAGWQIGVWGEDFISITMEGKTPGRYFANGLTDGYADYSMSFRHLEAMEVFAENNGYWFEGEQANEGPLATPNFSRRQIKMHSDVELTVGEFIWSGMFESMTVREDSQNPFLQSFSLSFVAWKEAFRQETPYPNPLGNSVQRGHTPDAYLALGATNNPAALPATSALPGNQPAAPAQPANVDPLSAGIATVSYNIAAAAIVSPPTSWVQVGGGA